MPTMAGGVPRRGHVGNGSFVQFMMKISYVLLSSRIDLFAFAAMFPRAKMEMRLVKKKIFLEKRMLSTIPLS